jgi:predicted GIY-YIG superfamily endonuclease
MQYLRTTEDSFSSPHVVFSTELASQASVSNPDKRFVYIIRSVNDPARRYIGVTADLAARLHAHNAGQNRSTAPWRPWFIDVTITFRSQSMAERFEKFLKSGAGHAFASRHFVDDARSEPPL